MSKYSLMTRGERISNRRKKLKLSPNYVGKYVGVTRVSILNWEENDVTDISWPKFIKLAEVLLTTPEWLEYGEACENYVCNDQNGEITKSLTGVHVIKSSAIPVVNVDNQGINPANTSNEYVDMPAKSGDIFALKLNMESKICRAYAGDALILDPQAALVPGEEVCIEFTTGQSGIYIYNHQTEDNINCTDENGKVILDKIDVKNIVPVVSVARNSYVKKRS